MEDEPRLKKKQKKKQANCFFRASAPHGEHIQDALCTCPWWVSHDNDNNRYLKHLFASALTLGGTQLVVRPTLIKSCCLRPLPAWLSVELRFIRQQVGTRVLAEWGSWRDRGRQSNMKMMIWIHLYAEHRSANQSGCVRWSRFPDWAPAPVGLRFSHLYIQLIWIIQDAVEYFSRDTRFCWAELSWQDFSPNTPSPCRGKPAAADWQEECACVEVGCWR